MKDSWLDSWLPVLTGVIGIIGTTIANRIDFRSVVRKGELENKKAEIENKDDVYAGWKTLYDAQLKENITLKEEYEKTRLQVFTLQDEFNKLKIKLDTIEHTFAEKEQGYLLQIEKLETKCDELEEENEMLKIQLKGGI
ncbi:MULTISPECIES: hypothetical protein [unclassified Enterococcus]|uniref:hypothetical protein n=1 Tax=unclassified Enterococcus TaxID=2608891 RepID=UPI003F1F13E7